MKPTSLLYKYLFITVMISAVTVGVVTIALYLLFRHSLEDSLAESTRVFHQRTFEGARSHIRATTRTIATLVAEPLRSGRRQDAAALIRQAREFDGALLIVILDGDGGPLVHAGDIGLLDQLRTVDPGVVVEREGMLLARTGIGPPGPGQGTVGQVFDSRIATAEVGLFRSLLANLQARHVRKNLILAMVIALATIALAGALFMLFVTRQVRAIRFLTRSTERLASGAYDEPITLYRTDEIGQLARGFDQLRERLRTTTISRDYLDRVLASMSEALLITSQEGCVTRVNAAASRLLEIPEEALIGRAVTDIVTPAQRKALRIEDTGTRTLESAFLSAGGTEIPVSYTISEIRDSDPGKHGFIIAARNITERKLAEQRIRYLARIDALTKVPNRMQFQHLLQRAIARAGRRGNRFALLYLDIDRFKDINDIYGHAGGDQCLETLTGRLRRLLPETAVIGRFAGDEFGVILDDPEWFGDRTSQLTRHARDILRSIGEGVPYHGQQIHMTASIGIALFPADANNVIDLLRNADAALYHAKRAGGDTVEFFDPAMNASAAERLMLKSRLRQAYERDELLLRYQPKVNLQTGRVAGAEALVRWDLAEHGIIMPSEFIPLAEESNLIFDIGDWVLDRVCRDFQNWQSQMLFPGKVSLNLSLKQLRQPDFSQRVSAIFRKYGVPPASLELEITESTLMENPERVVKILDELYNMGLSLAIDDFGTGYSSLSALQKFPISTLKVDQSFVHRVASDADDATIVTTIIQMGHGLNLDVIAEGVETEQQLDFLRTTGCDYVQGLLFGEPMSADDFMLLLMSQRQGTAAFRMFFE